MPAEPPDERPSTRVDLFDDRVILSIGDLDAGQRLDKFLRKILPGAKLGFLFKIIDRGRVRVDGARSRPGVRLDAGSEVHLPFGREAWGRFTVRPGPPARPVAALVPSLEVLVDDGAVLAIAKPAGLATHGGARSLAAAVEGRLRRTDALSFRVAPAHRLDRATSGIVLFGRTPAAQRALVAAFRDRVAEKRYLAIVAGVPPATEGVLRHRLARTGDAPTGPKMRIDPAGQEAETAYRVLAAAAGFALVVLEPRTGRTHQLRVQLAACGSPIVGDRRYGGVPAARLALHAQRLVLPHPDSGDRLVVEASVPVDFDRLIRHYGLESGLPRLDSEPSPE